MAAPEAGASSLFAAHPRLTLLAVLFVLLAWRVATAPPSPPPEPPARPWERVFGTARVMAVRGNMFGTISYVYGEADGGACAIVDSSGHASYILSHVERRKLRVTELLQTHGHLDHVQALPDYLRLVPGLGAPRMHPGDGRMLRTFGIPVPVWGPLRLGPAATAGAAFFAYLLGMSRAWMPAARPLSDGDVVNVGSLRLRVIHVPGHTPGSCCFYDETNGVMFSGDFLMKGTVGRSDLPQSDPDAMLASLAKIVQVPDHVVVLSGHTDTTTMGLEKRTNPWLAEHHRGD